MIEESEISENPKVYHTNTIEAYWQNKLENYRNQQLFKDPKMDSNSDRKRNLPEKQKNPEKIIIISRTRFINNSWRRTEPINCSNCNYPRLPGHDCLFNPSNPNALKRFAKDQRTKETISPEIILKEKFRI
ncbi:23526_t:CDS:2 [Racocetra persica]|uniref:23526_t:CDS:1 n=1 Tax=Racocetra persica TaxID=160502 RepID=A0ACA9N7M6_9GLOM|nr:23526_t:CDS:2 [Racocetra persica]